MTMFHTRMRSFRGKLSESSIDVALITDDDTIYNLTGYYDYLNMEFGRPSILVVPRDGDSLLITPSLDLNAARSSARVDRIAAWNDGNGAGMASGASGCFERRAMDQSRNGSHAAGGESLYGRPGFYRETDKCDACAGGHANDKIVGRIAIGPVCRQVANAMMAVGCSTIGDGVAEYEVALAIAQADTRKAAELLAAQYEDADMSPNTHCLQIMASGEAITKTHHRATTRIMRHGEPVIFASLRDDQLSSFQVGF